MSAPPETPEDADSSRGNRGWLWALLALAVAGGGGAYAYLHRAPPASKFETATIDCGTIVSKVTATGALSAVVTVTVGTQVSGKISELKVDFNSVVKKGDLIARIDPALFEANVEQAKAQVLVAEAAIEKDKVQVRDATRTFNRNKELIKTAFVAQSDVDTAETTMMAAQAQQRADEAALAQAHASLTQSKLNLSYTEIHAPISGVVISRAVDVGQTVAASMQAPVLFTVAQDLTHMQVDTSIAEFDVGKLKDHMKASFTVDAYPNQRFDGTIRQIRNAAVTTQNVVTYDAVIDVENPELRLRPGMTANITVVSDTKNDVVRVPNAALRFKPPADMAEREKGGHHGESGQSGKLETPEVPGMRTVYVLQDGHPHKLKLRAGVTDGTYTEMAEGKLEVGDQVITALAAGAERAGGNGGMTARARSPF